MDGELRKRLLKITSMWQDYLASHPAFAARLHLDERGPTWKDTVSWALWMLTLHFSLGEGRDHQAISRSEIVEALDHARQYIWQALYPDLRTLTIGEWRLYWLRVDSSFAAFFSDHGRQRWMDAAACAARTAAVRQGKSEDEQHVAEMVAVRKVTSLLRSSSTALRPASGRLPVALQAQPRVQRSPRRVVPRPPGARVKKPSPSRASSAPTFRASSGLNRESRAEGKGASTPAKLESSAPSTARSGQDKSSSLHLRLSLAVRGATPPPSERKTSASSTSARRRQSPRSTSSARSRS
jgi:hypothetical protein